MECFMFFHVTVVFYEVEKKEKKEKKREKEKNI